MSLYEGCRVRIMPGGATGTLERHYTPSALYPWLLLDESGRNIYSVTARGWRFHGLEGDTSAEHVVLVEETKLDKFFDL